MRCEKCGMQIFRTAGEWVKPAGLPSVLILVEGAAENLSGVGSGGGGGQK